MLFMSVLCDMFSRHVGMNNIRMAHMAQMKIYLAAFVHFWQYCSITKKKTCAIALALIEFNFKVQNLTYHDAMYHYNKFTLPALVQALLISCNDTYWKFRFTKCCITRRLATTSMENALKLNETMNISLAKCKHWWHFWQDFLTDEASLCNS